MSQDSIHDDLCQFIATLTRTIATTSILPPDHTQATSCIKETYAHLEQLFKLRKEITFVLLKDRLVSDDVMLVFRGTYGNTFMNILRRRAIERITFVSGLSLDHLIRFIRNIASLNPPAIQSTYFIKVGKVKIGDFNREGTIMSEYGEEDLIPVVDITTSLIREPKEMGIGAFEKFKTKGIMDFDVVNEITETFLENIYNIDAPLSMLASLKTANEYTYTHAINVGILTMCQAESLGFSGDHLRNIGTAAILHDIGKIFIPDRILLKADTLTPEERKIVESHSIKGARYLIKMKRLPRLTILVALEHHIRYDGSGYPEIKGGWETNIVSQMISIADVFDALRTRRPYREPMTLEETKQTLSKNSGTQFNPFLLERFLKIIER
ncbi:MAG: HD domain-containing protein [Deltaproteobacteria bacterium]|nr:HD domain-containing protein [Deltaproteobacteria bacterium]